MSPDLDYAMSCLPTCCDADHPPKYEPITYRQYRTWFMDTNYRPEAKPRYDAEAVQSQHSSAKSLAVTGQ